MVPVVSAAAPSPLARMVLAALEAGPGTPEDLGLRAKLPAGVVDAALAELRSAGRARPGMLRARTRLNA
jgi:hypothetical protein